MKRAAQQIIKALDRRDIRGMDAAGALAMALAQVGIRDGVIGLGNPAQVSAFLQSFVIVFQNTVQDEVSHE